MSHYPSHVTHSRSDEGRVALTDEPVALNCDVSVEGELVREDCYTSNFVPESGTVATELSGMPGETSSVAFGLTFAAFDPQADVVAEISGCSLVVDDDQSRAVTFGGPLGDQDGDGVPGDELIIRFADGSDTTLEQLFIDLRGSGRTLRQFLGHH